MSNFSNKIVLYPYVNESEFGHFPFHMAVFALVLLSFEPKLRTNIFGTSANHGGEGKFKNDNWF